MVDVTQLAYWILEREDIRRKKEAGLPKPWSDDPVFQTTYFCNVHREDDKVTKWIRENWKLGPDYEFAMCLARIFNNIPFLRAHRYPASYWSAGKLEALADELKGSKRQVWGNAYVVTTHGIPGSKIAYAGRILEAARTHLRAHPLGSTLASAHRVISTLEGFGSFMAAQVVADLKNTEGHPLFSAEDWGTWSAPGPGSMRGLNWVYDRRVAIGEYQQLIKGLHEEVEHKTEVEICEQDLQNTLCEFDKYMRVKTGSGRSKRRYNGT